MSRCVRFLRVLVLCSAAAAIVGPVMAQTPPATTPPASQTPGLKPGTMPKAVLPAPAPPTPPAVFKDPVVASINGQPCRPPHCVAEESAD